MPPSSIHAFDDPYSYQSAIRGAVAELVVTSNGAFRAELTKIDLHGLWLQRGRETLPRVARATTSADRVAIAFLAEPTQAPVLHEGRDLLPGELIVHRPSATHYSRTLGPCHWGSMSLTLDALDDAGRTLGDRALSVPTNAYKLRPSAVLMSGLLRRHRAAEQLVRNMPAAPAGAEVVRALEHGLRHAMVLCLTGGVPDRQPAADRCRAAVMSRFEELLEANHDRALYLAEICHAIGASERTLRTCCHERLGMSPFRYLWLRRMHLARRKLLENDQAGSSVTDVATEYGFWELGRFAVEYKALFGKSPSVSLRRPPDDLARWRNRPIELTP